MRKMNVEFAEMLQTTTGKLLDQITVSDVTDMSAKCVICCVEIESVGDIKMGLSVHLSFLTSLHPSIHLSITLSWLPCISRQTTQGIDLRLGGYIHHGTPQNSLTFDHTLLNSHHFLASDLSSSFRKSISWPMIGWAVSAHHLPTNWHSDWAQISWNFFNWLQTSPSLINFVMLCWIPAQIPHPQISFFHNICFRSFRHFAQNLTVPLSSYVQNFKNIWQLRTYRPPRFCQIWVWDEFERDIASVIILWLLSNL